MRSGQSQTILSLIVCGFGTVSLKLALLQVDPDMPSSSDTSPTTRDRQNGPATRHQHQRHLATASKADLDNELSYSLEDFPPPHPPISGHDKRYWKWGLREKTSAFSMGSVRFRVLEPHLQNSRPYPQAFVKRLSLRRSPWRITLGLSCSQFP